MFPNKESILLLCKKLNLQPPDDFEQDWEYEVVDPNRIGDFLLLYSNDKSLTENEKVTLGILIIGSLNEAVDIGIFSEDLWDTSWNTLKKDLGLHSRTLNYWACWGKKDITNCFPISQKLRSVLKQDGKTFQLISRILVYKEIFYETKSDKFGVGVVAYSDRWVADRNASSTVHTTLA